MSSPRMPPEEYEKLGVTPPGCSANGHKPHGPKPGSNSANSASGGESENAEPGDAEPDEGEPGEDSTIRLLQSRVLLGGAMEHGIAPPEELEPGILLKGKSHSLYAPSGVGKSWLGLWLTKQAIERGERVLVLDLENGPRTVAERLQELGADPAAVDEHLVYLASPHLAIPDAPDFEALLDQEKPDLVLFDSHVGFLARAALEENSNTDVETWAATFCEPARVRNITTVILDHVTHENSHARGAVRKIDVVDVSWKVHKTKPFDRERVGELTLYREKDREAWLPPSVKFSVGGGESGFIFRRSAGTEDGTDLSDPTDTLKPSTRKLLEYCRSCGATGATHKQLLDANFSPKSTLSRSLHEALEWDLIRHEGNRYYMGLKNPTDKPNPGSPTKSHSSPMGQNGTDESGKSHGVPHPLGVGPVGPDVETAVETVRRLTEHETVQVQRLIRSGMEPGIARAEVLGGD